MKIRDAGHGHGFSDDGSKDVSVGSAAVDGDIVVGRVNRRDELRISTEIDVRELNRPSADSVQLKIGRLVVAVDDALAADIDIAVEVNRRVDAWLQGQSALSRRRKCPQ